MFDDFSNSPRIRFGEDEHEGAIFIRVCPKCGRFVKADEVITFQYEGPPIDKPNATCSNHGRVEMIFEGYY